ncbi:Beta-Ig-H3 fasciclin (Partial), partial [Seminavis robusta]|eukprot:Sro1904_g304540.1 Beta-Ig-H3 fasciclin (162) ;mRNA; r:2-487
MTPSTMRFNALVAALFLPVTIAQVSISISNPQLSPTPAETITSEPTAAVPVTDALPVPTPRPTTMVVDTTTTSTGSGESVSVAPPLAAINTAAEADTIVGVARADEQFSTLLSAMDWVGMSTALTAPGPFTFFAPNNDAFATAPEAVGTWLQDPIAWEPQIR